MVKVEYVVGVQLLRAIPAQSRMQQSTDLQSTQGPPTGWLLDGRPQQAKTLPGDFFPLFRRGLGCRTKSHPGHIVQHVGGDRGSEFQK